MFSLLLKDLISDFYLAVDLSDNFINCVQNTSNLPQLIFIIFLQILIFRKKKLYILQIRLYIFDSFTINKASKWSKALTMR